MFNYLNQVYLARNPNASYADEPLVSVAPPMIGPPAPPPMIGPPAPPVVVGPQYSPAPPPGPVASVAQPPPPPVPQGPPPVQQAVPPPAMPQGVQDTSVSVSAPLLQYRAVTAPGRPAGNLNTMTPEKLAFDQQSAKLEYGAQGRTADRVSGAMAEQAAPLDERAQYLTALAEREARDQTGRSEQNRQMLEDYEREAKELRDSKPDPNAYLKSGGGIMDMIATVFGGVGQGFMRRAGDMNAENTGAKMAAGNRARFDAQQGAEVGKKQAYLQSIMQARNAMRESQGDQVASTMRQAALMQQATGAKLDKAGIGVAIQEAVSRGDMGQAQALMKLAERQAAEQHYVAAQGGGRAYQVKLANGAVVNMSEKEFNKYAVENEGKTIETGQKIAVDSAKAKAEAEGKGKDDEARMVEVAPGVFRKARTTEEAIKLDEQRRALEQRQGAIMGVKDARGQVGFLDRVANGMSFGLVEPKSIANLDARSKALVEAEAKRSGGVVTESDREGAKLRIGDQTSFSPFKSNAERLNAVQAEIDRDKELLDRGRDITTRAPKPVKKGW